jgi:hypothetical protein
MDRVRPQPALNVSGRRKSVFTEVGLLDEQVVPLERSPMPGHGLRTLRPARTVRFRSQNDVFYEEKEEEAGDHSDDDHDWESVSDSDNDLARNETIQIRPNPTYTKLCRLGLIAIVLALMLPILQIDAIVPVGVKGGVIPQNAIEYLEDGSFRKREDTSTTACKRWSGQCMLLLVLFSARKANNCSRRYKWHCLHVRIPRKHRSEANRKHVE